MADVAVKGLHDRVCTLLDYAPMNYGLAVKSAKMEIIRHLKPMILEMLHTGQLTRDEVRDALNRQGFRLSERRLELLLRVSSWEASQTDRHVVAKGRRRFKRKVDHQKVDAAIMEIGRNMHPSEMDPRILLRYWELARVIPEKAASNFFMISDMVSAFERRAREKWADGRTLEDADFVPDMKTGDEIRKWIMFDSERPAMPAGMMTSYKTHGWERKREMEDLEAEAHDLPPEEIQD